MSGGTETTRPSSLCQLRAGIPPEAPPPKTAVIGVLRTGYYLGVPILVVKDAGDGWVIGLWPDRENPGRSHKKPKPFTYRKLEWWKLRDSQVIAGDPDVTLPEFPVTLAPKPEPVNV